MKVAAVNEFSRFVRLEHQISSSEQNGIRARWEFGREMLSARDGKGRLPNGFLAALVGRASHDH